METTTPIRFKRRLEISDNGNKPDKSRKMNPNSSCYVQILGTGMDTQDTSPSVLLFFDRKRFIFNAGEGLQRFCIEHKIKLSKVDYIFLSRVCSETAGGLPGLLLTLGGRRTKEYKQINKLWGPSPGIEYFFEAMKTFVTDEAIWPLMDPHGGAMSDTEKLSEPIVIFNDGPVTISATLLQPTVDNELKGSQDLGNSDFKPCDISVIFVFELTEIPGKFDPVKAKGLGLKPGPKFGELQRGESVQLDNSDIVVHPSHVMDPPIPGPIVLLVDCPTTSHLQCLESMKSLNRYYVDFSADQSDNPKAVNCVIHLSPSSVTNVLDYQRWMKRFGNAQHVMAGYEPKNVQTPILKGSARISARLNYLCPQFFPYPCLGSLHSVGNQSVGTNSTIEVPLATISAENLLKFNLRPYANQGLDRSCVPCPTHPAKIIDELLSEIPEIKDAAQKVSQLWDHNVQVNGDAKSSQNENPLVEAPHLNEVELPSCLENISREDMEIILLGTGSSQPSRFRNVSSIYINLFSKGGLLFDCGEGTLGQLRIRFGIDGGNDAVTSLRCIWISHLHADHHAGLARVLRLRRDLLKGVPHEPLLVIGTGGVGKFMSEYEHIEELDAQFLHCRHTTQDSWDAFDNQNVNESLDNLKKVLQDSGLETLVSFPVDHSGGAFGVTLTAAQRSNSVGKMIPGWKIAYSGDTRPCPVLIEASRGATVLIHEATFEDGMLDDAVAKKHSTTQEAIDVGKAAGVYRIILTHFSQRYPKIPVVEDAQLQNAACIGFDLMSINMADLAIVPELLPYLKLLFTDTAIPMDDSD